MKQEDVKFLYDISMRTIKREIDRINHESPMLHARISQDFPPKDENDNSFRIVVEARIPKAITRDACPRHGQDGGKGWEFWIFVSDHPYIDIHKYESDLVSSTYDTRIDYRDDDLSRFIGDLEGLMSSLAVTSDVKARIIVQHNVSASITYPNGSKKTMSATVDEY